MTVAVAHAEKRGGSIVAVVDAVRERRPPFSPDEVTAEFAALMRSYRVTSDAHADRFAGDWPKERFAKSGVDVRPAEKPKSDIYKEFLPLLNSNRAELLDNPRLVAQLLGLERRTARGGRDSIDHAPNSHDDVVNAVAGALVLVAGKAGDRQHAPPAADHRRERGPRAWGSALGSTI